MNNLLKIEQNYTSQCLNLSAYDEIKHLTKGREE